MPMPHRTFAQVAKRRLIGKEGRERIREVNALKVMTNLIEPALIISMAGLVAFLLLGILSAMFSMISNIGGAMGR